MKNFIVLVIFALAGLAAYNYWEHLQFKGNTTQIKRDLDAYEQGVAVKRTELQAMVKAVGLMRDNQKKLSQISELQAKETTLKETQTKLNTERLQIIASLRSNVVNKPIPELVLKDGRKLNQATITQASDTTLTIAVPSGIVKITPTDLTPEWRQRLYY